MSRYSLAENATLTARNSFGVAARAELLVEVRDCAALEELFAFPMLRQQPVLVLGEGSNLLLVDDIPGVVVTLAMRGLSRLEERADGALLRAEAGVGWNDLVHFSLAHGLAGLENLALIPGTVGAAPIQNIGAYGSEMAEFVETVEAFDRLQMRMRRLDRAACRFGYRDSRFKREPDRWVVCAVEFALPRQAPLRLGYAGLAEELKAMGVATPRPVHVAEAVTRLRTRKLPDPAVLGNAGSFFKNPQVDPTRAEALRREHPELPVFPGAEDAVKLSAAWLIEACGWKGYRQGDAGVSGRHALVLVNHGHATGRELLELAQRIAGSVHSRFGVTLEPEPRIIGARFAAPTA